MNHTLSTQFMQAQRHRRTQHPDRQAGLTILSALLALAIGATVTYGQVQGQLTKLQITDGQLEGDLFNRIKDAQNAYALENYSSLQRDLPVSKVLDNGAGTVTLAYGTAPGQSLSPRVEDLVAMGYLIDGTTSASNKIPGGVYRAAFTKLPAGCQPAACNVVGNAYIDKPYFRTGTTEANGPSIGAFIERVGGDATVSLTSAPDTMISANEVKTPNLVPGGPAGVIGARVGFGSSGFGRFLVIGDSRDPKFRGGLTLDGVIATNSGVTLDVRGNTLLKGNVSLVDPATGVNCIDMLSATGTVSINCQGLLNAKAGTFTGPNGVVKVGDTGTASTVSTNGSINANQGFISLLGSLFSANPTGVRGIGNGFTVQSASGVNNLSVKDDGTVGAAGSLNSLVIGMTNQVSIDTACTLTPSTSVTASSVTSLAALPNGGVATCINGLWKPLVQTASLGTACAQEGTIALSPTTSSSLVCKNGVYLQVSDLLSSFVLMEAYRVTDGTIVPKPVCGQNGASVGVPTPVILGQLEASVSGTGLASFVRSVEEGDKPTEWRAVLKDSNGKPLTDANALFQSFCYY